MKIQLIAVAALALLAGPACAQPAQGAPAAACDRACLKGLAELYLDALGKRDISKLPLDKQVRFTENGVALAPGEGFWRTAGPATDYRVYAVDPEDGEVAVDTNMTENGALAPFLLRLKVEGGKITEVETVVTRKGASPIFAPETLKGEPALYATPVPAAQQASREALRQVADGYFTALTTESTPAYKPASFAPGANRIENGFQTTNVPVMGNKPSTISEQIDSGLFKGVDVIDRRYPVVDREYGVVLGVVRFGGLERRPAGSNLPPLNPPRPTPTAPIISEMFKITGGKIEEIRAVMVTLPANAPSGW